MEGDINTAFDATQSVKFLSTPSGWRATAAVITSAFWPAISIHALRVEGDADMILEGVLKENDFYPRPPGGGRLGVHRDYPVSPA